MDVFRIVVALLALIPIAAGSAGVIFGAEFPRFDLIEPNATVDSHVRFLSGIFLAVGIGFWSCSLKIGDYHRRFQILGLLVFAGGCARLLSYVDVGAPVPGHILGLFMEILVVPILLVWNRVLAARET